MDAIVANTHMGDETTPEIISAGNEIIVEAARILQLPIIYVAIIEELKDSNVNNFDLPVKYIKRHMPSAMW